MPSHKPRVSIGLPVYNGENYLTSAIETLLAQTFTDFELIISDNCSTDRTQDICRSFCDRDARIRYVRQAKNLGAVRNFNLVFHYARGEYFKWAAHDDVCAPAFLQRCVERLDANPSVVWCYPRSDKIGPDGESLISCLPTGDPSLRRLPNGELTWNGHPRTDYDSRHPHKRFRGVLLGTTWSVDAYALIRSAALQKTRLELPFYGSEKVLIGELSLLGRCDHIPELLFAQRIHPDASGCIKSAVRQLAFANSNQSAGFAFTRPKILKAHLTSVLRHGHLAFPERIRCLWVVAQYILQWRKWKRVVMSTWKGAGAGGGNLPLLRQREAAMKARCDALSSLGDPMNAESVPPAARPAGLCVPSRNGDGRWEEGTSGMQREDLR